MKIAVFGRTDWLYESAKAALAKGHRIVLIGTSPAVREYSKKEKDFALLAKKIKCAYFCDSAINKSKYIDMARKSCAEIAISVNWVTRISEEMIKQFPLGIVNAHGGDLPRFRGSACANWALIAGENKVVLTLHRMNAELDVGDILLQRRLNLTPRTYIKDIYDFYSKNIPEMFIKVLDCFASGKIKPKKQPSDLSLSLRCFPRLPRDNKIDWNKDAEFLARVVRAGAEPFSGAYSFIGPDKFLIWRAHAEKLPYAHLGIPGQVVEIRKASGEVTVLTGKDLLVIEEAEFLKKRDRASKIIHSVRLRLGMDIEDELIRLSREISELRLLITKYQQSFYFKKNRK
ncbi:MAG: formyltransferase family protein [Candidatus Omnitrophota bacterium]